MIIYGTRGFKKIIGSTMKAYSCDRCGNTMAFEVVREWIWFTLFFIPLIPLYRKYYLVCPHCRGMVQIKKKELDAYMQKNI